MNHVVYTPVTVYYMDDGRRLLSDGREEVRNICPTLAQVYQERGCMAWSVQSHEVKFCPYCGAEIVKMGKVITGEKPFSELMKEVEGGNQ